MYDSVPGPPAHCPPRLLLILGPPASGKTRLAEQLAARYELLVLRKDEIKEVLFDTLGLDGKGALARTSAPTGQRPERPVQPAQLEQSEQATATWSRALSDASFALLFMLAQRLRQPGRSLLLEGNFRPGEHEAVLGAWLRGSGESASEGAGLAQVLCHARAETLIARLEARARDPTRHRGHRDFNIVSRLRRGELEARFLALPGPQLLFDSEASTERELATLYAVLDPWMGGAARLAPR